MPAIRSLNFVIYFDNIPDITHSIICFKSLMVSEVEAVG